MDHFQNPHPILSSGEDSGEEVSSNGIEELHDFGDTFKSPFLQKADTIDLEDAPLNQAEEVQAKSRMSVSALKQKFERKIAEVKGNTQPISPAGQDSETERDEEIRKRSGTAGTKLNKEEIINEIRNERKRTVRIIILLILPYLLFPSSKFKNLKLLSFLLLYNSSK